MKSNIENVVAQQIHNPIKHVNYNLENEFLNVSLDIEGLLGKNYQAHIHKNKLMISALHQSATNTDKTTTPKFDCTVSTWSLVLPCSVDKSSISSAVKGDKLLISMLKA